MTSKTVYLSLGSNIGDRERNLRAALERLEETIGPLIVSSLYETSPVGVTDQPSFLNCVASGTTDYRPHALLQEVKRIEREVGRRPTYRWGPRVVDIDILMLGDTVLSDTDLTIPHREMANRAFVLVPLAEIAPDIAVPSLELSVRSLLADVPGKDTVTLYRPNRSSRNGSPSL